MARELVNILLFNGQAVFSQRLFDPETKDMAGKLLDKPSYSLNIRFPKTKANWYEEAALKPFTDACKVVMTRVMPNIPFQSIEFPIKNGDLPNKNGKIPEWAQGHWYLRSSSTFVPKVFQLVNGEQTELPALQMGNRKLWGDGDYVMVALSVAKRLSDNVGIRCYLNEVVFTGKGIDLQTGGASTDWHEAMQLAKAQGIEIRQDAGSAGSGFSGGAAPSGFPGAENNGAQTGFNPGGFNPGTASGDGFNPGGSTGGGTPF
jgi:hypothetical protein